MDKAERKRQLAQWRAQQRKAALDAFPLPPDELQALFDMLDATLSTTGCDHTLRLTTQWLSSRGHDEVAILAWLKSQGGFCDCEVLANVEEKVKEATRGDM